MHILQIDVSVNHGSTGKIAEDIGLLIMHSGWKSTIAYGRYSNPSESNVIKIGNKLEQLLHLILTRVFDRHGLGSHFGTKKLINEIKKINPDIIHLHQIHGYYLHYPMLFRFLNELGKPIVWTIHDCWAFTGHCCHFVRFDCKKWEKECFECPLKNKYPESWGFDNSTNNFRIKKSLFKDLKSIVYVPVSNWMAEQVKRSFLNTGRISTIQHGIDIKKFEFVDPKALKSKMNLQNQKVLLGVASPWSDLKGLHDFIKLALIIPTDWSIILIGLSPSQISQLPNNIIGIERLNNPKDLVEYYSMADVFVNPSIAESFGLVTIEAMACGTPVVGYDLTANPEIIIDGCGYVVQKQNIIELKNKIDLVLDKGRTSFSAACRNHVKINFNKEIQFEKYISLYKNLIKN